MKSFLSVVAALFLVLAMVQPAEAAKRFGSGGFGKSFSTAPTQQKSQPASRQDNTQNNLQQQPAKSASKGLMGGLLGGLLAGGLFAYLLGSGAFDGIQLMDILLLALVGFVIFKLLRRSRPAPQQQHYQAAGQGQSPFQQQPQQRQDFMSEPSNRVDVSSMMSPGNSGTPMNLPADFDQIAFIGGALDHYRKVQQAWNDGDLETIREYVAPELYTALAEQRQAMNDAPPKTEVLDLAADIVRADQVGSIRQISVLFRGRARDLGDGSEDGIFDTWHLERDMSVDNAPWLVVGIEAE
ncbi:Tim44 domain-containing protein [Oceanobacter mangrovi]|uniref:Tim44 domain-containing protein n=1 Tax=Oceanobacter mangrovi TaxID=2862510 RepID=UPI001C8E54B2|nr:TIM44-like domain-containing protein [Oceanobacter mangrovi]